VPKVNTDIFLQSCPLPAGATSELKEFVEETARGHLDDLSSSHTGYFSIANQAAISKIAGEKFCESLKAEANRTDAQKIWTGVVRDFHANNNWNFTTQAKPEKVVKPVTGARMAVKYFWAFFSSIVIIKSAVLFIGAEAAINPNPIYKYALWVAIAYSFLNLGWFGYKAYIADEKQKAEEAAAEAAAKNTGCGH
jgi:hypothetical protein